MAWILSVYASVLLTTDNMATTRAMFDSDEEFEVHVETLRYDK